MDNLKTLEKVDIVIVTKEGVRTMMPNMYLAESYVRGIWKGKVDRIEVTQTYKINE
jgi:hypothetical protein